MITEDHAKHIATDFINRPDSYWPDKPEMVITRVESASLGWLFYWTSSQYLKTGDISHALAGNGPIYVSRDTGDFETTGSRPPISDRVKEAEEKLKKKIEQVDSPKGLSAPG